MATAIGFETPENVQIHYQPAGLGHRFIAWLVDQILVFVLSVVLIVGLVVIGFVIGSVVDDLLDFMGQRLEDASTDPRAGQQVVLYFVGIGTLIWTFSSFVYFSASELFLRGQTIGKRVFGLRVVKANGFSLDPLSILVRNVFRVVDQISVLWIVPVLSTRSQRFGDMVAGTIVVFDRPAPLSLVRSELAVRAAADARFRFDSGSLGRLRPVDFEAVELLLDRWDDIPQTQLASLLDTMIDPLARRLRVDTPPAADRLRFLEDLLSAEYRRQSRSLA
jgi:uncharacterized RDD family membrane protein YckC